MSSRSDRYDTLCRPSDQNAEPGKVLCSTGHRLHILRPIGGQNAEPGRATPYSDFTRIGLGRLLVASRFLLLRMTAVFIALHTLNPESYCISVVSWANNLPIHNLSGLSSS